MRSQFQSMDFIFSLDTPRGVEFISRAASILIGGNFAAGIIFLVRDFLGGEERGRKIWQWLFILAGAFSVVYLSYTLAIAPMSAAYSGPLNREIVLAKYRLEGGIVPGAPVAATSTPPVSESPRPPLAEIILLNVPFAVQAPFGNWADMRQEDGCEEASALMAMRWVQSRSITAQEALDEIIAMSEYEETRYGEFRETSLRDTGERILKGYFGFTNYEVTYNIAAEDIKNTLRDGHAVIVAVNGQKITNPYYVPPGPRDHMFLIQGYDPKTDEFITNDPGTKQGEKLRYNADELMNALQDYPTGNHEPITQIVKGMIIIKR
jgi:hypothetical protein